MVISETRGEKQTSLLSKPFDALQHASLLARSTGARSAADYLIQRRGDWKKVLPNYDATLGNLLLQAGDPTAAVTFLALACQAFGDAVPANVRRALASGYLSLDRIEAAGSEFESLRTAGEPITRANELLALEAFQNRASDEPDAGPPTPFAVLLRAKALAAAGETTAAATLLGNRNQDWTRVPAEYDSLHRRLRADAIDRQAEVTRLLALRDQQGGCLPTEMQQALGKSLFHTGRVAEAGRELSIAFDNGANITRLDLLVAINSHRERTGSGSQVDTSFGKGFTFTDTENRLAYVSVPKNASSLLKSIFVLNSPSRNAYLDSKTSIHDFCDASHSLDAERHQAISDDYFRFTVVRDPARRLLSAYLDKFVRGRTSRHPVLRAQQMAATIQSAQRLAGVSYNPERSITFEEFVHYLAVTDDAEFNMHWMPQWRILGRDLAAYDHVGTVESLQETLDLLTARFGYDQAVSLETNLPRAKSHIAKHSLDTDLAEPFRILPAVLDRYEKQLPFPKHFLPPELLSIIAKRFDIDTELYQAASLAGVAAHAKKSSAATNNI